MTLEIDEYIQLVKKQGYIELRIDCEECKHSINGWHCSVLPHLPTKVNVNKEFYPQDDEGRYIGCPLVEK